MASAFPRVNELAAATPRPEGVKLAYGTAGFRAKADVLPSTFLRMGMLAALRSIQLKQVVGVMITASHNGVEDNGLKMVDPDGGMLAQAWEKHACDLANTPEAEVEATLMAIAAAEGIDVAPGGTVYVAKDTRPSSEGLCTLTTAGAEAMGAAVKDYGLLSTPQLHHMVRMVNMGGEAQAVWGSEDGYYAMLRGAYRDILQGADAGAAARGKVVFDAAGGVGGPKLEALAPFMDGLLQMEVRNGVDTPGLELNNGVGAEHVQKSRTPPVAGFDATGDRGVRLASVDGDADRLVYHYFGDDGAWHLLDGDAIAALAASFVADNLRALGMTITDGTTPAVPPAADGSTLGCVAVGVVQTAYANGASSAYIRDTLGMPVPLAKTGVKYVHHKALEYDIGVYFEANGHGTVVFSDAILARLRAIDKATLEPGAATALGRLLAAAQLINQAVGDAISDAMFIEAVLAIKGWGITDWDAMYTDLPSRQTKLAVANRTDFVTVPDETRLVEPAALQDAIDELVSKVDHGRAFVRPSGTEDVVRVYAEAATAEAADALALDVKKAAHRIGGGLGDAPSAL